MWCCLAGVSPRVWPAEHQRPSPSNTGVCHGAGGGRVVGALWVPADVELHRHEEPGGGGAAAGDGDADGEDAEGGPTLHIKACHIMTWEPQSIQVVNTPPPPAIINVHRTVQSIP